MAKKIVAAGAFKQGCLALIDQVAETRTEILITKRGKPVARLIPVDDPGEHERRLRESWRGKAKQLVDDEELIEPSSSSTRWNALSGENE